MSEDDETVKHLRKVAKALDDERITEFSTIENNGQMKVGAKLNNGMSFTLSLDDKQRPLHFTNSEFSVLKEIITTNNDKLIKCVNGYKTSDRNFEYFFYDLAALAWYIDKLPQEFSKLKKVSASADELMHDRIHAQLAYHYKNLGKKTEIEVKHADGTKPDLRIDGIELEIKSLVSAMENTPESFLQYSKSFRNAISAASKQIIDRSVIAIAPWSQIMNNVWKVYFRGLFSTKIPELKPDNVIIVLDGGKVLEDFYLVFKSKDIALEQIRIFAESGYQRIDVMSYMNRMNRTGFMLEKSGSLSDMHNIGIGFRIG
ncbi:MAG: hypothetical protein HY222_03145 [Thaumarchaeota archaeon]|nr:hypothetical protein [Nitrososphaerota archaeon]MBI3641371.1 hypothetical protein [Nitrososphaerota archaeon]